MPYPYTYRISENDSADSENSPAYTRESVIPGRRNISASISRMAATMRKTMMAMSSSIVLLIYGCFLGIRSLRYVPFSPIRPVERAGCLTFLPHQES